MLKTKPKPMKPFSACIVVNRDGVPVTEGHLDKFEGFRKTYKPLWLGDGERVARVEIREVEG